MSDRKHPRSIRTGDRGIAVGGDVEGDVTINNYQAPKDLGPDEAALQRGYLQWLMAQCRPLSLASIDYGTEDPRAPRLGLEQVYTALMTIRRERDMDGRAARMAHRDLLPGSLEAGSGPSALVVLRDFAAGAHLPPAGTKPGADVLRSHLADELARCDKSDYLPHLRRRMLAGEVFLLLDGLDEVVEADRRREQVLGAIRAFADAHGDARILVIARPYAYQRDEWRLDRFADAALADFSDGQIRRSSAAGMQGRAAIGPTTPGVPPCWSGSSSSATRAGCWIWPAGPCC